MDYQPTPLPVAIRGGIAVDDRNVLAASASFGPVIAYRMAARTWDQTVTSEPHRQAIWSAIRSPKSADDAADERKVDRAWLRTQLDKRAKYLASIATRLGLPSAMATRAQHDDLRPVAAVRTATPKPASKPAPSPDVEIRADWTPKGGTAVRSDGTVATFRRTTVDDTRRRAAVRAARDAARQLGLVAPSVAFYEDTSGGPAALHGAYVKATPTTVWLDADLPFLDIAPTVRHEVGHMGQYAAGLPITEPLADAFAAGKKSAINALRGN